MDGDPAVEPELDTFSLILPLPYRIGVIVVLGMTYWTAALEWFYSDIFTRGVGLGRQPALSVHP